jgi:hypothetical protein
MKVTRSHYLPRTRNGRIATIALLVAIALTQPPIVHGLVNRIEPWILGMPFLFAYLLAAYLIGIGVLIWTQRRKV